MEVYESTIDTDCKQNDEDASDRIERYLLNKKSLQFASIEGISFLRYCIAMIDEDLSNKNSKIWNKFRYK